MSYASSISEKRNEINKVLYNQMPILQCQERK